MTREVKIGDSVVIGGENPLVLIAGPCVIEDEELVLRVARRLREITSSLGMPFIFKSSYDKANRTSLRSFRGPGLKEGLAILKKVKEELGVAVLSDIHQVSEAEEAAKVLDVIQIPAFLSRQTDLVLAAAKTGLPVNVKKGQFLSPWEMAFVVEKITSCGNYRVMLTERGTTFGYQNLVNDMRAVAVMRSLGYPVVYDATHSVQLPGAAQGASGGQREFIPTLVRAAVAAGADGLFMEVHPDPPKALSDKDTVWPLEEVPWVLEMALEIHRTARRWFQ
ncbi:MAG: 3-deoxy-8-phosphooctulonate synthase [Deltaproteobacteria bacterium]|nr:MAG: 3-deoxy-8-phosphooctulonate synthase [Deltaproteobacteria bacterium]